MRRDIKVNRVIDSNDKTCGECKRRYYDLYNIGLWIGHHYSCKMFFEKKWPTDHKALRDYRGNSKRCQQCLDEEVK